MTSFSLVPGAEAGPSDLLARLAIARDELETARGLGRSRDVAAFRIAVDVLERMLAELGPAPAA